MMPISAKLTDHSNSQARLRRGFPSRKQDRIRKCKMDNRRGVMALAPHTLIINRNPSFHNAVALVEFYPTSVVGCGCKKLMTSSTQNPIAIDRSLLVKAETSSTQWRRPTPKQP
ncbi:hypothetical protein Mal65_14970 [Crateriforma conspicua]|nr:hypothetical protein Mal65_14970 [Crateriforma conspicua]